GQADNADHPQKKRYGRLEMVGPFSVRDGEDNYQLYLIRPASTSQSDFINLLFDRPPGNGGPVFRPGRGG
ncbi:MAG: hypothetical protein H5U34_19255, partial [Klebsiella pneumoniae]|nr:hypothetical protein [Klebsiella pneumoniae]